VRPLVPERRDPHTLRDLDAAADPEDRASVGDVRDGRPGAGEQRCVARVGFVTRLSIRGGAFPSRTRVITATTS
jgi:hypothetical protein